MAYLGLVPGEHSSGERTRRDPITKTGNTLVRRLLIEAAWHYQHRAGVGLALRRRREGQAARVIALADKAQQRLSTLPALDRRAQTGAQGRSRRGSRTRGVLIGRFAAGACVTRNR
jgi:transposase